MSCHMWTIIQNRQFIHASFLQPGRLGMGGNLEECFRSWPRLPFTSPSDRWNGRIKAPQGDPGCPLIVQVQREQVGICSVSVIKPRHMILKPLDWSPRFAPAFRTLPLGPSQSPGALMSLTPHPDQACRKRHGPKGGSPYVGSGWFKLMPCRDDVVERFKMSSWAAIQWKQSYGGTLGIRKCVCAGECVHECHKLHFLSNTSVHGHLRTPAHIKKV